MEVSRKIGENIKRARKNANLTQEELSKLMNISRASVVNYEKGRQMITINRLMELSEITGFSMISLLKDEGRNLQDRESYKLSDDLHLRLDKVPKKVLLAFLEFYIKTTPSVS